jgi:hypothetical protein
MTFFLAAVIGQFPNPSNGWTLPDLRSLLVLSLRIVDEFSDDLLKCRNYYRRPKAAISRHAYRAIYFQISIDGRMVELQIMSDAQETISFMDHSISFKKTVPPLSGEHLDWGALIVDAEQLPKTVTSPAFTSRLDSCVVTPIGVMQSAHPVSP